MYRDYEENKSDSITFFVGTEIESSPFVGMKTLFVVGVQSLEDIKKYAEENEVENIYLTANHSWKIEHQNVYNEQINNLTRDGYCVTIETPYNETVDFSVSDDEKFCHIISVALPSVKKYGKNATIKVDDLDFKYSNAGVWVAPITKMSFTDWDLYSKDKILE